MLNYNTNNIGIHIPTVLLANKEIDLFKWCVVACDQYTSQADYWKDVEKLVGDMPSTLHLVFPEIYLEDDDSKERIEKTLNKMNDYLENETFIKQDPGFIFIDRQTSNTPSRKGLIIGLDLEKYNYEKSSQSLIRATEETVIERIPPRVKIRENAPIETPHIMILIDDPGKTVIEPLAKKINETNKVYDTKLMMGGGHIKGYSINNKNLINSIINSISKLADPKVFHNKYNISKDTNILLYAVGDGNHSLATAKACWENIKPSLSKKEMETHPARFALVELVNVYDEGLIFEPIHRILFNVDVQDMIKNMTSYFSQQGSNLCYKFFKSKTDLSTYLENINKENSHLIPFISEDKYGVIIVKNPTHNIEVGTLQTFLDFYISNNEQVQIDYIHGEDIIELLAVKPNNIGFLLPPMDKHDLFKTVILDGVLPRKTFSMGDAEEKRFYLECRKIK